MGGQTTPIAVAPLRIGDTEIERVVDLDRFELQLRWLFPNADPAALEADRHWLEPAFMQGETVGLSIHSTILRIDGRIVLIDTCVGEHKPRPRHAAWNERPATPYLARLAAVGLRPEDVDVVLCTHLHADHVGWNTRLVNGRWVPTFPKARYLIGRAELAHWQERLRRQPEGEVNHGSYADSVLPVIDAGMVDLVESDHEIANGLVVRALPGHTPGQVGLSLRRGDAGGLFVGDAIHHPVQLVRPDWSSSLCADPDQARITRQGFLAEAAERGAWLLPAHFIGVTGMRIRRRGDGYAPVEA
ncbi:MAG TPA: MBL fold metallo-hydrolase [Hyphomicrobiales bacterium]|nr:MBL fold metallo-hydrolase [Hyphomicrobiales bacterium]